MADSKSWSAVLAGSTVPQTRLRSLSGEGVKESHDWRENLGERPKPES